MKETENEKNRREEKRDTGVREEELQQHKRNTPENNSLGEERKQRTGKDVEVEAARDETDRQTGGQETD